MKVFPSRRAAERTAPILAAAPVREVTRRSAIGLVNNVYPREKLMATAMGIANEMVSKTKLGRRLTKDALNGGINLPSLENAVKIEDRNQALLFLSGLHDRQG
jgi:hypothetical protein